MVRRVVKAADKFGIGTLHFVVATLVQGWLGTILAVGGAAFMLSAALCLFEGGDR